MQKFVIKAKGVVKTKADGKRVTYIEGIANKAIVDRIKDYIPPDEWDLKNFERLPMIFFNHDRNQPIGKAVSVKVKEDGLHIKARISSSSDPGISRVRDLIEEDILSAFSVGINPGGSEEKTMTDGTKVNVLKQVELLEVSVVSIPMNQESFFSLSTKSLGEMDPEKFAETKALIANGVTEPPKEEKTAPDGSGLPNNEPIVVPDVMKTLSESQVTLLASILNELKMMNQKMVQTPPPAAPVSTSENTEEAAKIAQELEDRRRARLDLLSKECDKIFKRYGI